MPSKDAKLPLLAIAQQNTPTFLNMNIIYKSQPINVVYLWKLGKSQLKKFLWHCHAYSRVFGLILLTLVSLIFLGIHWTYRKFFFTHAIVEANEWDLKSSN
ncbi:hypothetical protein [Trichormus azollae]|jgi:hypothetical protein|uniref:hypothetical protein n=1 Tax=Trichormus azollae TaxID=1164 RepID=UPI00117EBE69|nr:hypothetical protein [Trichormus azollae]